MTAGISMADRKCVDYGLLRNQLDALMKHESDMLANSANFVALVFNAMSDVNWLGIYVLRNEELVLGPFQGRPACVRIPMGQGVCGTAALQKKTQRVADVNEFDGHIACDPASRSEIVVPLVANDRLIGVLDIDSPSLARFTVEDQKGVEALCDTLVRKFENGNAAKFI
jgi:GAF domain-containing protein